jgi:hypothetical protein
MKNKFKLLLSGLLITAFLVTSNLSTKAQVFDQGDKVLSLGLGLGATYIAFGTYYKISFPPVFVAGDYCLRENLGPGNLGVGAIFGFSSYKYDVPYYDWGYKSSTIMFGGRGSYHFVDLVDKLDLYGGLALGMEIYSYKEYGGYHYNEGSVGLYSEVFAGARYYFSDNFAVMGEIGYGFAWLKIGVSLKL